MKQKNQTTTVGFDIGGIKKGIHGAALQGKKLIDHCEAVNVEEAAQFAAKHQPKAIGVDSPRRPAPDRQASRTGERQFVRASGMQLFYTPNLKTIKANPFHGWVLNGFELYRRLEAELKETELLEVFPSALWQAEAGVKQGRGKAAWSQAALTKLGIQEIPEPASQDLRDAIGAAWITHLYQQGKTISFEELTVPASIVLPNRPNQGN